MSDQSQRTEKPTPRRILKSREQGDFIATNQLLAGVQFFVVAWLITYWGGVWFRQMGETMHWIFQSAALGELEASRVLAMHRTAMLQCILPLVWAGVGLLAILLIVQFAATQFGISAKKLVPDLGRLNPVTRLSNVVHSNLSALVQALILLPLFGYVLYKLSAAGLVEMMQLPRMELLDGLAAVRKSITSLIWQAALILVGFGFFSYGREYMRYMKKLRMTKQDVRDEAKETEGNPLIKGRVRRLQRDLRRRRMLRDVPSATAVIVNPTHYSVAIRYETGAMRAPIVVAKGKNLIALRIRQIAVSEGVPIVENPPLARGLYASVEVNQEIPPHLYRAVAEILSLIYRMRGRGAR